MKKAVSGRWSKSCSMIASSAETIGAASASAPASVRNSGFTGRDFIVTQSPGNREGFWRSAHRHGEIEQGFLTGSQVLGSNRSRGIAKDVASGDRRCKMQVCRATGGDGSFDDEAQARKIGFQ